MMQHLIAFAAGSFGVWENVGNNFVFTSCSSCFLFLQRFPRLWWSLFFNVFSAQPPSPRLRWSRRTQRAQRRKQSQRTYDRTDDERHRTKDDGAGRSACGAAILSPSSSVVRPNMYGIRLPKNRERLVRKLPKKTKRLVRRLVRKLAKKPKRLPKKS